MDPIEDFPEDDFPPANSLNKWKWIYILIRMCWGTFINDPIILFNFYRKRISRFIKLTDELFYFVLFAFLFLSNFHQVSLRRYLNPSMAFLLVGPAPIEAIFSILSKYHPGNPRRSVYFRRSFMSWFIHGPSPRYHQLLVCFYSSLDMFWWYLWFVFLHDVV